MQKMINQFRCCAGRHRVWYAIAAIGFGAAFLTLAAVGWHYERRLEAQQDAHNASVAAAERRHTREKNEIKKEVVERLDRVERILIGGGNESK